MRKIYRFLILFLENLIVTIHISKTWVFEWISVLKKSGQYRHIVWSKAQKKEFTEYWKENYGRKISCRWHKLYQSANGIFNVEYFPEILYTTRLEPICNPLQWCKVLSDKGLLEVLFGSNFEFDIPKTIALRFGNFYYDEERSILSPEKINDIVRNAGTMVIKPTSGSASGEAVMVINMANGIDIETGEPLEMILKRYTKNYVIQEFLSQNAIYAALNPSSVNTIRIMTYILDGRVDHLPLCLRVGTGSRKVDNIHAGGIGIGVSDNGKLNSVGYDIDNSRYYKHPDSGVVFEGYEIPYTREIIEAAYRAQQKLPNVGIASWDFMVSAEDRIVLIEVNLIAQGSWFPQILSGQAFGNNTKDVLKMIRKKRRS